VEYETEKDRQKQMLREMDSSSCIYLDFHNLPHLMQFYAHKNALYKG